MPVPKLALLLKVLKEPIVFLELKYGNGLIVLVFKLIVPPKAEAPFVEVPTPL